MSQKQWSLGAAAAWLRDDWGLEGELSRLPGYQDDNFLVRTDSARYVFRVSHPTVSQADLERQDRAMRRVASAMPGVSPMPIESLRGRTIEARSVRQAGTPRERRARLLSYVEGRLWADARPVPSSCHRSLGQFLARLDRALCHPDDLTDDTGELSPSVSEWNLECAGEVVTAHLGAVLDSGRRALIARWLARFSSEVAPGLAALPRQLIHGDANDHNLLTDAAGVSVTGIIDFGDAMVGPRIAELAIAIAYAVQREFDALTCAATAVAGYCAETPLTDAELAALPTLVAMRLATTVTLSAHHFLQQPENSYLQVSAWPAWRTLEQWSSATPELLEQACMGHADQVEGLAGASIAAQVERRRRHLAPSLSTSYRQPLHMVRGRGQFLFDHRGRAFLDCVNNVCHVGHGHPSVVASASEQMAALNTNTRYLHDAILDYADQLRATLPPSLSVCTFVCSGSEANDLALRIARTYTGQRDVVVLRTGYHGNTGALIEVSPYKFDGPGGRGAAGFVHPLPVPDRYRGAHGYDATDAGEAYANALDPVLARLAAEGRGPALLMVESLLGCGGQIELPAGYLAALYRRVRAAGGLCLADEVQVGFGRIGSHFWGFQSQGVVPDIVTMGKPMGNGHPLAAVVTTRAVADGVDNGMEYFNTFGGNPVSCRVGASVLQVIESEGLQENARVVGAHLLARLRELMERHPVIGDVRGRGLFLGVELVEERTRKTPASALAETVIEFAQARGVLLSLDGPGHNVIKIKPPLVFTRDDADLLVTVLDHALQRAQEPVSPRE